MPRTLRERKISLRALASAGAKAIDWRLIASPEPGHGF